MTTAEATISARIVSVAGRLRRLEELARFAGSRAPDAPLEGTPLAEAEVRLLLIDYLLGLVEKEIHGLAVQFVRSDENGVS